MRPSKKQITNAKKLLKDAGYQTDIMFNITDITYNYHCSEEVASEILEQTYEDTEQAIWEEIVYKCNYYEIQEKD